MNTSVNLDVAFLEHVDRALDAVVVKHLGREIALDAAARRAEATAASAQLAILVCDHAHRQANREFRQLAEFVRERARVLVEHLVQVKAHRAQHVPIAGRRLLIVEVLLRESAQRNIAQLHHRVAADAEAEALKSSHSESRSVNRARRLPLSG